MGRDSFGVDEMSWNQKVVMVVQPREYTKTHRILHFKKVNFMTCELYLDFKCFNKKKECSDLLISLVDVTFD